MAENGVARSDSSASSHSAASKHSDHHHKVAQNSTGNAIEFPESYQGAGKDPGMETWRIEQFEPVKQDPKTHGKFYNEDAYIVLVTKKARGLNKLSWDIHFWLGKRCTQDESGSAAIRTVELDEYLGGAAVQHREVQSHESKLFLSYFKKGIKYLEGGVKSGFTHVDRDAYVKRLFQCKGKQRVRVEQVEVKCGSLNQSDVFILDDGPNMYVWLGPKSNRATRAKGVEIARDIRDEEKAGRSHIHVVEEDWNTNIGFFKALGSRDKLIRASDPHGDEDILRKIDQETVMYKIFEKDGDDLGAGEVAEKPFSQKMLTSGDCFVLDSGYSGMFVWTGKDCTPAFKKKVWICVNAFIEKRGYPDWMTVSRVMEGFETALFKQYYPDWEEEEDEAAPVFPTQQGAGNNVAEQSYESIDASEMHKKAPTAQEFMPDKGDGEVKAWRIQDFELASVQENAYGIFFGGDSYVIKYTYEVNGRRQYIIYFWQGLNSSTDEKGASALHAMKMDDDLGGEALQIRVVQNKEPDHFLKMFKGRIVVFSGGNVSGFQNIYDHDTYQKDKNIMFHIRGTNPDETRALQVDCRGSSLNNNDVFIVHTPKKLYVWVGKDSDEYEKDMARHMVQYVAPGKDDLEVISEGHETLTFWAALGGKEPYYTGPKKKFGIRVNPRLFHCSNSSGKFTVEEVVEFTQEDLDEDDVMILDTFDEVFVWIGKGANEFEKKESLQTAYNYLKSDPTDRNADNTLIIVVRQGSEPPAFTGQFVWDLEKWNEGRTFAELIADVGKENAGINLLEDEVKKYTATHPLDVLQRRYPPEGVDVRNKENYLSDEEFEQVFHMNKDQFKKRPTWKQVEMKKAVKLF